MLYKLLYCLGVKQIDFDVILKRIYNNEKTVNKSEVPHETHYNFYPHGCTRAIYGSIKCTKY